MIEIIDNIINGMAFALGTILVSTIALYIGIKRGTRLINQVVAKIAEAWSKVKKEITIDARVETKINGRGKVKRIK